MDSPAFVGLGLRASDSGFHAADRSEKTRSGYRFVQSVCSLQTPGANTVTLSPAVSPIKNVRFSIIISMNERSVFPYLIKQNVRFTKPAIHKGAAPEPLCAPAAQAINFEKRQRRFSTFHAEGVLQNLCERYIIYDL